MSNFSELFDILLRNSATIPEMDFRLLIEKIYQLNPAQIAPEISALISSPNLDLKVKLNIIRLSGYLQNDLFLLPLKKIIDEEKNIHLKKEALIAISKFNNRKALNILSQTATRLQDPLLLDLVKTEIAKIKKHNPILAMLPNFLLGDSNNKLFRVSVQILKRILSAESSLEFISYLNVDNEAIRQGAFEIITSCSDERAATAINKFFLENVFLKDSNQIDPARVDFFLDNLKPFLERNGKLIGEYFQYFQRIYDQLSSEQKLKLIAILTYSSEEQIFDFLNAQLARGEFLKEIISAIASSENGATFLIKKSNLQISAKIFLPALLKTRKGSQFLLDRYPEMKNEEKLLVLDNQTDLSYQLFGEQIKAEVISKDFQLQSAALGVAGRLNDLSIQPVLTAEENFLIFEKNLDNWFQTMLKLFPLDSFFTLLKVQSSDDSKWLRLKRFIPNFGEIFALQPIWPEINLVEFEKLAENIIGSNQLDLNLSLLNILKNFRTFSAESYNLLVKTLQNFSSHRHSNLTHDEINEIKKVRLSLLENTKTIQLIAEGEKLWKFYLNDRNSLNLSYLEAIFKKNPLFFFVNRNKIINTLFEQFSLKPLIFQEDLLTTVSINPYYAFLFQKMTDLTSKKSLKAEAACRDIQQNKVEQLKIHLMIGDNFIANALHNQLRLSFEGFTIISDWPEKKTDILISTSTLLKNLLVEKKFIPDNTVCFLEKIEDFSLFKKFEPICLQSWNFSKIIIPLINKIFLLS